MSAEMAAMTKALATVMKDYVQRSLVEINERLSSIEARPMEKGDPGKDAEPIDVDAVVANVVSHIRQPKDGVDGKNGNDGQDGDRGTDGVNGRDGKGVAVEDFRQMFDAEYAKWQLDFERRANEVVHRYLEKIPAPTNGKDGLGFDDFSIAHDGERLVTFALARGGDRKEWTFEIPTLIDRGVFKRGDTYQKGDGVTHGGSFWIAQATTDQAPGEGSTCWRLSVKRGRDGKSA